MAKSPRRISVRAGLAIGVTFVAAIAVVSRQPLGAPWWIYADADATYTATGMSLMSGYHTFYLDHPGVPLEALMAMTVETRYLAHKLSHEHASPRSYVADRLLHLDDSRPYFRGWAVLFYLLGAACALFVGWRLVGGPWWGAAASLLWLGAPGLPAMSMQFRPDGLLAGLVLAVGFLIVRAAASRDAWVYVLAAFLLGLTLTVKIHAAGLLLPLLLALVWRPPAAGWTTALGRDARAWFARHWISITGFFAVWTAFAVTFNRIRDPLALTGQQRRTIVEIVAFVFGYALLVWLIGRSRWSAFGSGLLSPLGPLVVVALISGVLLPGALFLNDLPQVIVKIVGGLTGGEVNAGITPFSLPWNQLLEEPLRHGLVLFVLAGVAAAMGVIRKDPEPALWFAGALATGGMALARLGAVHYFAPAYVLSIPAALWLIHRLPPRPAAVGTAALVGLSLYPVLTTLSEPAEAARFAEDEQIYADRLASVLVNDPDEVALSEEFVSPTPDVRYHGLVEAYLAWRPDYRYRFLPDSEAARRTAVARRLRPTAYIGRLPTAVYRRQLLVRPFGAYRVRPLPELTNRRLAIGALELVHGPGVDQPYGHPDAPYDPETGYFKDATGRYYDVFGRTIIGPLKRRYIPKLGLWLDANGDYWDAKGRRVQPPPTAR